MSDELPHSAGRPATGSEPSSRVRVYRRSDVDGIFMTRAWITTASGRPKEEKLEAGITEEGAVALADLVAAERRKSILDGRTVFGEEKQARVKELWTQYLASSRADDWSEKYRGSVERSRDVWLRLLDGNRPVANLTTAEVNTLARDARKNRGLSPRWEEKRLKHLRSAVIWGLDKAQLYDRDPLRGLEYPDYHPETRELIYSPAEIRKLVTPHEDVDWRITLACNIAADTGRRISAILALTVHDVLTDGERVLLRFRWESDKGKREGLIPISKPTAPVLADAMERQIVQSSEFLFPEGRLGYDDPRDKPMTKDWAVKALHEAEETLGIDYVKDRAFHGIKRRHVTTSAEVAKGDLELVGDLTGNVSPEVLRKVYRWQNTERMVEHVDLVRAEIEGREPPEEPDDS